MKGQRVGSRGNSKVKGQTVRLRDDALQPARMVAAFMGLSLTDYISDILVEVSGKQAVQVSEQFLAKQKLQEDSSKEKLK